MWARLRKFIILALVRLFLYDTAHIRQLDPGAVVERLCISPRGSCVVLLQARGAILLGTPGYAKFVHHEISCITEGPIPTVTAMEWAEPGPNEPEMLAVGNSAGSVTVLRIEFVHSFYFFHRFPFFHPFFFVKHYHKKLCLSIKTTTPVPPFLSLFFFINLYLFETRLQLVSSFQFPAYGF